jgi:hypothetical protein
MLLMHSTPLLLSILVGLLIGLIAWGFWRTHQQDVNGALTGGLDDLLVGFLVLAGFASGVLLTYLLTAYL